MNISSLRALMRVQLLTAWRGFRDNTIGKSKWGLMLIPLLLLGVVPLALAITGLYVGLFYGGQMLGQGHVVLTLALTAGQLACLAFGVLYVISAFYFSQDLKLLIPLPLRPSDIVLAKFLSILLGEYLTMLPVVAPALAVYGVLADVTWTYVPFAALIFLLLPVIPLVLASLFSMLLMRVTNLRRNRDLWRVFGALLGVGLVFLINYLTRFQSHGRAFGSDPAQMQRMLEQQRSLVEAVGRWFPTSLWATDALRAGAPAAGAFSFLLFAAVALAALVLMTWVAEKLFYGGAPGGEENRTSGKVLSSAELARETGRVRSPLRTLLDREIKLMNRTPSFLMAALLPLIMVPVLSIMPFTQEGGPSLEGLARFAGSPLVPAIGVAAGLFFNSLSNVAATAISREGRHFWISRSLPVAPHLQVQAKVLHSLLFAGINLVAVLGVLAYMQLLTPGTAIFVAVGGALASTAAAYGGILIDLLRPNLKWTDPQRAMKGNTNSLFSMLLVWATLAALAGVTALFYFVAPFLLMPAIMLLFALLAWLLSKAAGALADRRYLEIED
jgi:ABC-2 type transport system permease protein